MSNLKNTPWRAEYRHNSYWQVWDSKNNSLADFLDEPTAKAMAALPETLAELEALKSEQQAWQISNLNKEHFKAELEKAEAERDELKKAFKSFITEMNSTNEVTRKMALALAQELLKDK